MDFTNIFKKYKGLWVALSPDETRVLGKGKNAKKAFEEAKKKSAQIPYMFKVPTKLIPYVSSSHEI